MKEFDNGITLDRPGLATTEGFALIRDAVRGALNVERAADGISISRLPGWTRAQYGEDPMTG